MTQEEKQLVLQDLSARLPYGVICQYNCVIPCGRITLEKTNERDVLKGIIPMSDGHIGFMVGVDKVNAMEGDIKPYLRPMASMTEEERKEYNEYLFHGASIGLMSNTETACELIDWLNKKMFDYRGLIPMNLAIEVPEGMYNITKLKYDKSKI